ncbi:MAG: hypothetical protein ACFB20_10200 [Opitutales bacterium]
MKLPRDLSGAKRVRRLCVLDYPVTRQRGSHVRSTTERNGRHHEVIPLHDSLKPDTLASIL